ncbi:MAG: hypothetical protein Q8O02_03670, partial [Candidatus Omnitrophota bacterium]|nr:hypothetical protein [Candidatus Omnitrophota bacterium]
KIKVSLKGIKDIYALSKYVMDSSCSRNCEFKPSVEKDVDFNQDYVEAMELTPYSVQLLIFKKKPAEVKPVEVKPEEKPAEVKPVEVKPEEKALIKEINNAENK